MLKNFRATYLELIAKYFKSENDFSKFKNI